MQINIQDWTSKAKTPKERKDKFRADPEKKFRESEAQYLARRFIAVDGEGINVTRGKRKGAHDYVLLAVSDREPILNRDGLSTMQCLDYLWHNLSPANHNVIFGGGYDFNCWIADFPETELQKIYDGKRVAYGPYTLSWIRGKMFRIKRDDKSITIYDVVSFFQKPFIQACDEYLKEYKGRAVLVKEKANRSKFTWRQISAIGSYNGLELRLLERLCNELRLRLNKVGLRPVQWIGPGAVAAALMRKQGIKAHMSRDIPEPVQRAARFAYAGGRFECIKSGVSTEPVYEYDLNSAYPKALSLVPSLAGGKWVHSNNVREVKADSFALYRIRWDSHADPALPGPFYVRAQNGTISYPLQGENWIWTPEAELAEEYARITGMKYRILESWTLHPATNKKPFGFVPAMYEKRKALKAAGDGAHVGVKLGLNSLYGKTCQQVGFDKRRNLPPTYHQLEWGGYATSYCRARVLKAAMQDLRSVIAFETDALFTTRPLHLPTSDRLGEWELTEFSSLTYVQSGHYYGTTAAGKEIARCRGIDRGNVTRASVEARMLAEPYPYLEAPLTRFMGAGIALRRGYGIWRHWITETKRLALFPLGKRYPMGERGADGWRETWCPVTGGHSAEYPVLWINPDERMTDLAEMREAPTVWDE